MTGSGFREFIEGAKMFRYKQSSLSGRGGLLKIASNPAPVRHESTRLPEQPLLGKIEYNTGESLNTGVAEIACIPWRVPWHGLFRWLEACWRRLSKRDAEILANRKFGVDGGKVDYPTDNFSVREDNSRTTRIRSACGNCIPISKMNQQETNSWIKVIHFHDSS